MKEFDFESADFKKHHHDVQMFLRRAFKSGMSEDEFVQQYQQLPRPINAEKGYFKSKKGRRAPSTLRTNYQHLKKTFDFF